MFKRDQGRLVFQGVRATSGCLMISAIQAEQMIEVGCEAYLVTIVMAGGEAKHAVGEIRVV